MQDVKIKLESTTETITLPDGSTKPATENQKGTGGDAHVNADGPAGDLWTKTLTIDGTGDIFTDPTAPLDAEMFKITIPAGKKRLRVRWHQELPAATSAIPYASAAVATINAPDDATALSRLTVVNNGVGSVSTSDDRHRMLSAAEPILQWDTQKTDIDITKLHLGGLPNVGTGAIPIRITVEAW